MQLRSPQRFSFAHQVTKRAFSEHPLKGMQRPVPTWTLQAGIFARPVKPPATPSSFAAVVVPTIADRFGARTFIRELTYMNICLLMLVLCQMEK